MAVYADYTYYSETYLGTAIAQADFPRLALRASKVIDQLTFGQAAAIITAGTDAVQVEAIQMATCAVAEELQLEDNGEIQSERVGSHSVTYVTKPAASSQAKRKAAAKLFLWDTDLMYGGPEIET